MHYQVEKGAEMSDKIIDGERYRVVIKIDQSTVPADGQKVVYETYEEYDIVGEYIASEGLICREGGDFDFISNVFSWQPIE